MRIAHSGALLVVVAATLLLHGPNAVRAAAFPARPCPRSPDNVPRAIVPTADTLRHGISVVGDTLVIEPEAARGGTLKARAAPRRLARLHRAERSLDALAPGLAALHRRAARGGRRGRLVALPGRGVDGNSHMLTMDRNSNQIARMIQTWLAEKGLMPVRPGSVQAGVAWPGGVSVAQLEHPCPSARSGRRQCPRPRSRCGRGRAPSRRSTWSHRTRAPGPPAIPDRSRRRAAWRAGSGQSAPRTRGAGRTSCPGSRWTGGVSPRRWRCARRA